MRIKMHKRWKQVLASVIALAVVGSATALLGPNMQVQAAAGKTGAGLAEYAMNAYQENWTYQYGAATWGRTDCSGLIYVYAHSARSSSALISAASEKGSASAIPRIHGLGLWKPGHVGIYVGNGMAVDNRNERKDIEYGSAGWASKWFKVPGVSYPTNGWVTYQGQSYYYENGQYVVSCTKTIDGKSYTFNSRGVTNGKAPSGGNAYAGSNKKPVAKPAATQQKATPAPAKSATQSAAPASSQPADKPADKPDTAEAAAQAAGYQDGLLQLGSKGDAVKALQTSLSNHGFYVGQVTGTFDRATEEALRAYQARGQLTVDGKASAKTVDLICGGDALTAAHMAVVKPGQMDPLITEIQKHLIALGYLKDEASGVYGSNTKAAVLACQKDAQIPQKAELDADARRVLLTLTPADVQGDFASDSASSQASSAAPSSAAPSSAAASSNAQ